MPHPEPTNDRNLNNCRHYGDYPDNGTTITCVNCQVDGSLRQRQERVQGREASRRSSVRHSIF